MAKYVWILVLVGAASLGLSAYIDLYYFPPTVVFGDELRFLRSASHLAETGEFSVAGARAWEMPGTAIFIAGFIRVFSDAQAALLPVRLVQAVLVVLQAVMVGLTAQRIFKLRSAGAAAFAMVALYPFFLFYQGLLLSETLFNTVLVAAFASLYWWRERAFRIDGVFFLTCVLFGLATMVKPTLTIAPPVLIASLTLTARSLRLTIRALVLASVTYAAVLAPWATRNYLVLHAFVPFTTSASENLYLGNNEKNTTAGISWMEDVDEAVVARLRSIPDEVERQRAFGALAIKYIADNPVVFLQRAGQKFVRFWNIVPNAPEYRGSLYRIVSAVSFGGVLTLSIISLLIWRRQLADFAPLLLLVAYFSAIHMITIASLRYRLPLEPFLILIAAGAVSAMLPKSGRVHHGFEKR